MFLGVHGQLWAWTSGSKYHATKGSPPFRRTHHTFSEEPCHVLCSWHFGNQFWSTNSKSMVCRWKMPSLTRSRVYISRFKALLSVHPKEMGLQGSWILTIVLRYLDGKFDFVSVWWAQCLIHMGNHGYVRWGLFMHLHFLTPARPHLCIHIWCACVYFFQTEKECIQICFCIYLLSMVFQNIKTFTKKNLSSGRNLESQQATLPETNSSHLKNGCLEYDRFLLGLTGLFSVARLVVSGRVLPRYIGIKVSPIKGSL